MSEALIIKPQVIENEKTELIEGCLCKAKPVIATKYKNGILIVGENPYKSLHKIHEIHDKIAFAASGMYNHIIKLAVGGINNADLSSLRYSDEDVRAFKIAENYALTLGDIFDDNRFLPYKVEMMVVEINDPEDEDDDGKKLFRVKSNGHLIEEDMYSVIADLYKNEEEIKRDSIRVFLKDKITGKEDLKASLDICLKALGQTENKSPEIKKLEMVVLDCESKGRRVFKRYKYKEIKAILD